MKNEKLQKIVNTKNDENDKNNNIEDLGDTDELDSIVFEYVKKRHLIIKILFIDLTVLFGVAGIALGAITYYWHSAFNLKSSNLILSGSLGGFGLFLLLAIVFLTYKKGWLMVMDNKQIDQGQQTIGYSSNISLTKN